MMPILMATGKTTCLIAQENVRTVSVLNWMKMQICVFSIFAEEKIHGITACGTICNLEHRENVGVVSQTEFMYIGMHR